MKKTRLGTGLSQTFAELRINISSVMELDYYGALLGGLIFAFFALPYLGLTYTPICLGFINFLVAAVLYFICAKRLKTKSYIHILFVFTVFFFIALFTYAESLVLFGEQQKYKDKVNVLFINVTEEPILASRYGIQSIPVQIFFDKNGKEFFRHVGFFPQDQIETKISEMGSK